MVQRKTCGFPGSVRSRAFGKAGPGVPVGTPLITSIVLGTVISMV